MHVRWAASVDDATRTQLEKQLGLTDGRFDSGTTWVYLLTSPSQANIAALVRSPAIEDTHHIDRVQFQISPLSPRRGPYVSPGAAWVPRALFILSVALAGLGGAALIVVGALTPGPWAWSTFGAMLILIGAPYLEQLRLGAEESAGFRVGDWLVNYQVGFVRRGLPGSPLLAASSALRVPPERVVLWLQVTLYALFFALLLIVSRRKRLNIWFLAFLFSPLGLLFPLYDPAVMGRKDVLFFVAFALYACWMPNPKRRSSSAMAAALGAAITLTHELFFFFVPYFLLMRALQDTEATTLRGFVPELSLASGSLVALLLASTAGADIHGAAQCAELLRRGFDQQLCEGIMRYPVTTIGDSIDDVALNVRAFGYLRAYPSAALLGALPLLLLFRSNRTLLSRRLIAGVLLAVTFTLPMFVIAVDWGRLLNIHVIAIAVVVAAFVLSDQQAPRPAEAAHDVRGSFWGTRIWWLCVGMVLTVCVYVTTWSVRHCCDKPLRAGIFAEE